MNTLTIFYDARCGICGKFRAWLESQRMRVPVMFLAFDSAEAGELFPGLEQMGADRDLVVLSDDGSWWQGSPAWLTCLWATVEYRDWSFRLAAPAFQPLVKKAVHLLSENRFTLSRLMRLGSDAEMAQAIHSFPDETCESGICKI